MTPLSAWKKETQIWMLKCIYRYINGITRFWWYFLSTKYFNLQMKYKHTVQKIFQYFHENRNIFKISHKQQNKFLLLN